MKSPRSLPPLLAVACLVLWLGGCGGSDSTTAPPGTTGGAETTAAGTGTQAQDAARGGRKSGGAGKAKGAAGGSARSGANSKGGGSGDKAGVPGDTSASFTPPAHHDSGGGSGQFKSKGGDNSIQEFGSEASGSEFAAAAAALHAYLDARAAHAWAAACEYLSGGFARQFAQMGAAEAGEAPSCPRALASLSAGLPDSALREAAVADVASFQVEGDSGFLLFHGADGTDWFVPMSREGGAWKVAAIAPSALP